nr:hypothetical protein [uncultured Draconibacterium sp.]
MKHFLLILTTIFLFVSCSNKEKEAQLQSRITELENQLDECQNGADKIHAKMKLSYEQNDFNACKSYYQEMKERHPDSELFAEVKSIYDKIIKEENEKAEQKRLLAEKLEKERMLKVEREKQEKLKALKKLRKKYDDVSNITWYKQPYFTHYTNTNLTSIYMGESGNSRWLRLMMSYQGNDWIFFEHAYLSYDGNTKEIIFDKYDDKKTENSGDGVWEWIDLSVTKDVESFLREFAKSKNAKMRLSGKYTKTRTLTYNERQGILDVLNGYDVLESGIK